MMRLQRIVALVAAVLTLAASASANGCHGRFVKLHTDSGDVLMGCVRQRWMPCDIDNGDAAACTNCIEMRWRLPFVDDVSEVLFQLPGGAEGVSCTGACRAYVPAPHQVVVDGSGVVMLKVQQDTDVEVVATFSACSPADTARPMNIDVALRRRSTGAIEAATPRPRGAAPAALQRRPDADQGQRQGNRGQRAAAEHAPFAADGRKGYKEGRAARIAAQQADIDTQGARTRVGQPGKQGKQYHKGVHTKMQGGNARGGGGPHRKFGKKRGAGHEGGHALQHKNTGVQGGKPHVGQAGTAPHKKLGKKYKKGMQGGNPHTMQASAGEKHNVGHKVEHAAQNAAQQVGKNMGKQGGNTRLVQQGAGSDGQQIKKRNQGHKGGRPAGGPATRKKRGKRRNAPSGRPVHAGAHVPDTATMREQLPMRGLFPDSTVDDGDDWMVWDHRQDDDDWSGFATPAPFGGNSRATRQRKAPSERELQQIHREREHLRQLGFFDE